MKRLDAIIFLATVLLFLPTWLWLGNAWLSDPYYSHGPLVLIVVLYFIWARRRIVVIASRTFATLSVNSAAKQSPNLNSEIASSHPSVPLRSAQRRSGLLLAMTWNNLGFLLVIAALGVHLWAVWWSAFYISALMIPVVFFGLLVALYGMNTAKHFVFPLVFLVFMVPLPIVERVGPVLEGWTATSATAFAQFIGVAARNEGSQVFLPNSTFTVGIPCGGLRSVIAIGTLVTLWAYIVAGSAWARGIVLLAAIPIALAANTLRIAILFGIASAWGAEVGLDYFHSWSSPVLFLLAFALLLGIAKLVGASNVRWEVVAPS